MAGRVFVCTSSSDDPFLNLALEDGLFRRMGTEDRILFLWQSRPCVVIGRFQNPWVECSLEALEKDGADLVRRQSGGGTVYHDKGNTNFTFLSPAASFDADQNLGVVTAALKALGIDDEIWRASRFPAAPLINSGSGRCTTAPSLSPPIGKDSPGIWRPRT